MERRSIAYLALASFGFSFFFFACRFDPQPGRDKPSATLKHEPPDRRNNPALLGVKLLPLEGIPTEASLPTEKQPWSGYYWPTYKGGIGFRWQRDPGGSYLNYLYQLETQSSIATLSQRQLDALSPAEKYDLLRGDYDFEQTLDARVEVLNSVRNLSIPYWYGYCHGWAPSAIFEVEPGPLATVRSPQGLTLNFYSADIKALLAKHYGDARAEVRFVGGRCNAQKATRDVNNRIMAAECRDINPATLHLVLATYIAQQQKTFIIDVNGEQEVWNQPVMGYKYKIGRSRPLSAEPSYTHPAPATTTLVDIDLNLHYVIGLSPQRKPQGSKNTRLQLSYTLELDDTGLIIGGEWRSDAHPDFMWEMVRRPDRERDSALDYKILQDLLQKSRQANQPAENTEERMEEIEAVFNL